MEREPNLPPHRLKPSDLERFRTATFRPVSFKISPSWRER